MAAGAVVDFDAAGEELLHSVQQVYRFRDRFFVDSCPSTTSSAGGILGSTSEQIAALLGAKRAAVAARIDAVDGQIMQVYCSCRKKKRRPTGDAVAAVDKVAAADECEQSATLAASSNVATSAATDAATPPTPPDGKLDGKLKLKHKARYFFLRGYLYNCLPEHSTHAEQWLEKSLKQEPRCAPAWNSLGESYWKRGDMENARICFETALNHDPDNSEAMRRLSIVCRQLGSSREEKRERMEQSIQLGHAAVKVNVGDGESWFILGNAYLKRFFDHTHDMHDIKKALNAYNAAIKDVDARWNADIYYSRAVLHEYLENFTHAARDYQQAVQLDPSLQADAVSALNGIYGHVFQVAALIAQKAHWKAKRLSTTAASISGKCSASMSRFTVKTLSQLTEDTPNTDCMIFGKVVLAVQSQQPNTIRRTWLAIAPDEQLFEVSVYNVAPNATLLSPGDEIVIAHPHLKRIHLTADYASYTNAASLEPICTVRVENPLTLCIDGVAPRTDAVASVGMHVSARTD